MKIPTKSLKNGFAMPVFGLGTWQMGGRHSPDPSLDEADITAIKTAIEMGVTHLDTAESYADGHAEELVAEATASFDRGKLFIVSKVSPNHFSYEGIISSCKASLKRLKTAYLDLYLLHRTPDEDGLAETIKALDFLFENSLIKNIGVSNFSPESMQKAQSLTRNKIVTNQVHYSLLNREPEASGLLEFCQKEDIFLTAYRPVEKGILTTDNIPLLKEIADKYHKTPAQIAINWLISQDHVATLAKSSSLEHLKENLGAVGWEMKKEDVEKLRQEFPNKQDISGVVRLA
jgi:diketogulonate reductase-like aldo/keto reductase